MSSPNRRQFIASTALLGAAPTIISSTAVAADAAAPNARINLGVIGCGSRGYNLIDAFLSHEDCQIVAVCDVDQHHYRDRLWGKGTAFGLLPAKEKIEKAYAKKSGKYRGLETYSDYHQLIADADIDAIVVATPDHWHALCTLTALRANKDVYCEKPVTHLFPEGQQVYREVKQRAAVFQTGSQQRSDAKFRRAVELVRNGLLGAITKVEVGLPPGYDKPQGDTKILQVPKQLDYNFWCGPSSMLPYMRARHHRWWRGHRAYGGGVLMDWIGHHNDIAHWALDVDHDGPTTIEATEWVMPRTGIYNTPEHYTIECSYAGGVESTISTRNEGGLKLIGDDGWVFVNRGVLKASDERWLAPDFDPGDIEVYRSDDHSRNFLDCVKSRQPCIAPAETAHRSITPGHLAYFSAERDQVIEWDAKAEVVKGDDELNTLLQTMHYRAPLGQSVMEQSVMELNMLKTYQSAIANQFAAAFCTLDQLVDLCPSEQWDAPVVKLKYCQVAFHTLFFSDVYLGPNLAALKQQPFHKQNQELFGDYEELSDNSQQCLYSKADIKKYLQHCRTKAKSVIAMETEASLAKTPGFDWLDFSRAEVHVYNLRHLYHHAAQLSLRLRIDIDAGVDWVRSGWKD